MQSLVRRGASSTTLKSWASPSPAPPFRLFSSTPILPAREDRLGYDRPFKRKRKIPALPPSTAFRYFRPEELSSKPGETSTAPLSGTTHDAGPKRSFIFDLPDVSHGGKGHESARDRRLRVYHEGLQAENTIEFEMEHATWYSDPWCEHRRRRARMC